MKFLPPIFFVTAVLEKHIKNGLFHYFIVAHKLNSIRASPFYSGKNKDNKMYVIKIRPASSHYSCALFLSATVAEVVIPNSS